MVVYPRIIVAASFRLPTNVRKQNQFLGDFSGPFTFVGTAPSGIPNLSGSLLLLSNFFVVSSVAPSFGMEYDAVTETGYRIVAWIWPVCDG